MSSRFSNLSSSTEKFTKSNLDSNNLAKVFAVFLPTQAIHKAVSKVYISIFLAFSTQLIKFSTDFSLNHSNSNINSDFSEILNISTRL
jgi:hypothetical protein